MKTITINIRTKTGWRKVQNSDSMFCDRCKERLWIAPNRTIYCNGNFIACIVKKQDALFQI